MARDALIEKIKKENLHNKKLLLSWVQCLPKIEVKCKPSKCKVGDVYMHPTFNHPYVLLYKKDDVWVCGLLTSDGDFEQVLEKCRSRFFEESFFTKVLFTVSTPIGGFKGVYDNTRHLKKVYEKLTNIFK